MNPMWFDTFLWQSLYSEDSAPWNISSVVHYIVCLPALGLSCSMWDLFAAMSKLLSS